MKTQFNEQVIPIGNTDSPFLGPNPNRVGLILSADSVNRYNISFQSPAVLDRGIVIPPNTQALIIKADDIGSSLTQPIRAIAAAAITVSVVEIVKAA